MQKGVALKHEVIMAELMKHDEDLMLILVHISGKFGISLFLVE